MNKQIEEMAKIIDLSGMTDSHQRSLVAALDLYNADYRKQIEGEWILEHELYGKMQCSNCKEEALVNECNEYVDSDFCPNCGAKMKGGADDA